MQTTKSNFDLAFSYTVGNEGGYTNDTHDSGGPTNWGITQHDLSVYLGHPASIQDVKSMSSDTAKAIYKRSYWDPLGLDAIVHYGVAAALFDIGVVRGIGVPPKYAQNICNNHGALLVVDGHIGPKTLGAINALSPSVFIKEFAQMVERGFRSIAMNNPTQNKFLGGWINRAHRLLTLIEN